MSPTPQQQQRTTLLRQTSHAFCQALLSPPTPTTLLSTYFTSSTPSSPQITEHGPAWATSRLPFLGKTFTGVQGCEEYFQLLSATLEMQLPADAFPGPEGFIVDAEAGMVSVVGKGRFMSKKTGRGWEETFVYRFSGFDGEGRIGWWEIWADPLSAWEAVGG
ncbi:hypothetical protein BU26DRAFT_515917 [Trematosphaeria pertusa]|uniref:SnoaL-like domain-containing protein n=1 Tax=Trematosphaeria pertusa TaxID=390896 RepID=A0A6A6IVE6_9PLEO|nr:uncharacterized protein BU26DRAFT_515917 [Trematosphaeria pertusa]KAF2253590.1 hypothetical protein BU26DRAFT_515917 [Trematosphaeria pertusa]